MRFACWIIKATDTHTVYVILIAFLQQQFLHNRATVLSLYVYCLACCLLQSVCPLVGPVQLCTQWLQGALSRGVMVNESKGHPITDHEVPEEEQRYSSTLSLTRR
jgi:hypothetical protein